MKRRLFIVAGALALILIVAQQLALAQNCTTQSCIYLPAQQMGAGATPNAQNVPTQDPGNATATADALTATPPPIVGPTPDMGNPCNQNAPAPVEGAQAWIAYQSISPFTSPYLCTRLIVHGRFVLGIEPQAIVHGATWDGAIQRAGAFQIENTSADVGDGNSAEIDVAVRYLDRVYLAHTHVTYPIPPTITPTP